MSSSLLRVCQRLTSRASRQHLLFKTYPYGIASFQTINFSAHLKSSKLCRIPYISHVSTASFFHRPPHHHRFRFFPIRPFFHRLTRKIIIFGIFIGAFAYFIDADFITYGHDLYRSQFDKDGMTDKTIWVIGASSGIGEYLVYDLVKSGARRIIISSRRKDKLETVKQNCEEIIIKSQQTDNDISVTIQDKIDAEIERLPDDGEKDIDASIYKQIEEKVSNEWKTLMDTADKNNKQRILECEIIVSPLDILNCLNINDIGYTDRYINELMEELNSGFISESNSGGLGLHVERSDIDIVVINSGRTQKSFATENSLEILCHLQEINVLGPIEICKSMVKYWRNNVNIGKVKRKNKKLHQIALTSSLAGVCAAPRASGYSMSKAGINRYLEAMRIEVIDDRIDVNLICPGPVEITSDSHQSFGAVINSKRNRYEGRTGSNMKLERCAQLYSTALQYSLIESWISTNPVLLFVYLRQYLPILYGPLGRLLGPRYTKKNQIESA